MTIPTTIIAGLIVGAILAAAQWVSPMLMPWILGYMIACLAKNLRVLGAVTHQQKGTSWVMLRRVDCFNPAPCRRTPQDIKND